MLLPHSTPTWGPQHLEVRVENLTYTEVQHLSVDGRWGNILRICCYLSSIKKRKTTKIYRLCFALFVGFLVCLFFRLACSICVIASVCLLVYLCLSVSLSVIIVSLSPSLSFYLNLSLCRNSLFFFRSLSLYFYPCLSFFLPSGVSVDLSVCL